MKKSLLVLVLVAAAFAGQYDLLVCHCDPGKTTGVETYIGGDPFYDSVDFVNCHSYTPTVAEMEEYGCVFTWSNEKYSNPTLMGDNLADYMDGGGSVLSCAFAHFNLDYYGGLSGRYANDENYCPLTLGGHDFSTTSLGTYDPHHIMDGVESISDIYYWEDVSTEAPATWIADLANGTDFVAINRARNAVGINLYPGDHHDHWTDDGWTLLNNAIQYLMDRSDEDTEPPFVSEMDPGDGEVDVFLDSTIVFHCKDYISGVDTDTIEFFVRYTSLDPGSASVSSAFAVGVGYAGAGVVTGDLDINGDNPLDVICTFTPDEYLPPDTTIICVVDDKLADLCGNEMGDIFIWTFTTGEDLKVEQTTWGAIKAGF